MRSCRHETDPSDPTRLSVGAEKRPRDFATHQAGTTAVEYGLIGGIMAVALIAALPKLAKRQRQNYRCINRAMRGKKANRFCKKRGA